MHPRKEPVPLSFDSIFELNPVETKAERPNFIFYMTDEERAPSVTDSSGVKTFYRNQMPGKAQLAKTGITFTSHYAAESACIPSRTALLTSQYSDLTGMDQTDGVTADPVRMLPPNTVPTIGNYLEKGGYRVFYIGKYHLAYRNLPDKNGFAEHFKPINRPVDEKVNQDYAIHDPLGTYGFHGWRGADPHGVPADYTGANCDKAYTHLICHLLDYLNQSDNTMPWAIFCMWIQPHDIVLSPFVYEFYRYLYQFPKNNPQLKINTLSKTISDPLTNKPSVQKDYVNCYGKIFSRNFVNGSYGGYFKHWNPFNYLYLNTYYSQMGEVDNEAKTVQDKLRKTKFYRNTWEISSTDHGDNLGDHRMCQKWLNAYRGTVNIPLIISHPELKNQGVSYDSLTSHIQIMPTILKLAGLSTDDIQKKLALTHSEVHPLAGRPIGEQRDYSGINTKECQVKESIYFTTSDNPFGSDSLYTGFARLFPFFQQFPMFKVPPVKGNTRIDMVVGKLEMEEKNFQYKYALYRTPNNAEVKLAPEEELYNLTDPHDDEMKNLIHEKRSEQEEAVYTAMKKLLAWEMQQTSRTPNDPLFPVRKGEVSPVKHPETDWRLLVFGAGVVVGSGYLLCKLFQIKPEQACLLLVGYLLFANLKQKYAHTPRLFNSAQKEMKSQEGWHYRKFAK